MESPSFCETENNPTPSLFFIRLPTNKHFRTRSSMIHLWIDSRTCQKKGILLLARQKSDNCLELSKENVLWNMMLSHWPCFTWAFFMIWLHRIIKLIFQISLHQVLEIYVLNIKENNLTSQFSQKISYTLKVSSILHFIKSLCENFPNFLCRFWKHNSVFLRILYQYLFISNITSLYLL